MASERTPAQISLIAAICQTLAVNDRAFQNAVKGFALDQRLARYIYMNRRSLDYVLSVNPSDTTLQAIANYVYALCSPYIARAQQIINNLQVGLPVLTGPTDQSTTVGNSATFSVSVSGTGPFMYQWYVGGVVIAGATSASYIKSNAQLSDDGKLYSVQVTNVAGSVFSGTAKLNVTSAYVAFYYYGDVDYSSDLMSGNDSVPYLGTFPVTAGQPLSFTWPSGAANNKYIVVKYPGAESVKTQYSNLPLNNGLIPSIAFENVATIGSFKYIFSRGGNPFSMNTANALIFS